MKTVKELKSYLLLWGTQSLSALGSGMTSYALVLWLYRGSGSALSTALLRICSYAPYVLMSIFAGALSDKWNKKRTMLVCDLLAAITTAAAFLLIKTGQLCPWHLYVINAVSGLMNTVQQPAAEVAATQLIPKEHYQKTGGLRSFSQSLNTILTPVFATLLYAWGGIGAVIITDLLTFGAAFSALLFFIKIPEPERSDKHEQSLLSSAASGLRWLKDNPLIMKLIFFLSGINLIASAYTAALPALIIPKASGGEGVLGAVNACAGIAALLGSIIASALPVPKSRVRLICLSLFFSMSTENFLLALTDQPVIWCVGAVCGWLFIPVMGTQLDVIFRSTIPADMQGRVYSCRNTLQFFTIPIGGLFSGVFIDRAAEPLMAEQSAGSVLTALFGEGKGSGAAMLLGILGIAGVLVCTVFTLLLRRHIQQEKLNNR